MHAGSVFLLLLDLVDLEVLQKIMLDLNLHELERIHQKTLIYSSEVFCAEKPVHKQAKQISLC